MVNVVIRAHYLMKRISQQQYSDLQRQYHYLYRNLPVGATILDLPSASQIKMVLKKDKVVTDKYADRINATCMKTSVIYARNSIEVQQPVLAINTLETGAKEEQVKANIVDFSLKLTKLSQALSKKFLTNPFDISYYASNLMAVPNATRHLKASFHQEFMPTPSVAKKDLLVLDTLDDDVKKAADFKVMEVKIDSPDAKLLAIAGHS